MTAPQWADEPELARDDEFLAFWRDHRARATQQTVRILGVDVPVPSELPMAITDAAEQITESNDPADLERVVAMLFGSDVYAQWKANGLTTGMLSVLVTWGMSNAVGQACTFEEAAELAQKAEEAGKVRLAANRAARRASSPTAPSATIGRSSWPTSGVSTAFLPGGYRI